MKDIVKIKQQKVRRLERDDEIFYFNTIVQTHKIDGTNARIIYDGEKLQFGSKNRLLTEEKDNFGFCKWGKENIDIEPFHAMNSDRIIVFGEFYGGSIQGRIKYGEKDFRAFDVYINSKFLNFEDVVDVVDKLGLEIIPYEYKNEFSFESLQEYCEGIDPLSKEDANEDNRIKEGIVVRPPIEVTIPYDESYGGRIMYKVKSEKFAEVNEKKGANKPKSKKQNFSQEARNKVDKYINENRIIHVVEEMKEKDPDINVDVTKTGDVIKNTIKDIQEEARETLPNQVLGKYGGGKISKLYRKMLQQGKI